MPVLPEAKRKAYVDAGLTPYQAGVLTSSREMAEYSDAAFAGVTVFSGLANWIAGPLSARLNDEDLDVSKSKVSPEALRKLAARVADGTLSGKMAKEVFDAMWAGEGAPDDIIEKKGLKQISDAGAIEKIVDEVLAANEKQVADYRAGKEKAFNSLVGQVMKRSQGKANPAQVNEVLRRKLKG
jgi:aspartyl-tRNA(Asn)/glutamyl-tRNA(Gln) amidotransferase subunit B